MILSRSATRRRAAPAQSEPAPKLEPEFAVKGIPISTILNTSTNAVAVWDKLLRCTLANHVFTSIKLRPAPHDQDCVGKTLEQVFGSDTPQIEPAFQRVWHYGRPISDIELQLSTSENHEGACLAVNLLPIKDAAGTTRLVAAVFSDVTTRKNLQRRLRRLQGESGAKITRREQRSRDEYAEVPAESAKVLKRGIDMLGWSAIVRCHLLELRIANAFLGASMFVALEPDSEKQYQDALKHMVSHATTRDAFKDEVNPQASKTPSPRERQIVQLLVEGKANKEIAEILALSTRTVEGYRARLMEKLDLHSMGELVRYAFRNHIVEV